MSKFSIKEDKLKPLLPTLRQKKRFVRVQVISNKKFDFKEVSNALNGSMMYYLGAIDYGKGGVWILRDKFDSEKQELIIRIGTKFKDKLLASLLLVDKVGNIPASIKVLRVSGTLKGAYK